MSEQADDSQKTEEPTPKKLREAQERGNVAVSREINTWLMLVAAGLIIAMALPPAMQDLKNIMLPFVASPHEFIILPGDIFSVFAATAADVGLAMFWIMLFVAVVAALGPILQNGLVFSPKALEVKLNKMSPASGAKRLFSSNQLNEFFKGIIKLVVVSVIGVLPILPMLPGLDTLSRYETLDFMAVLHEAILVMLVAIVAVLTVIALADLVFQRFRHNKQLRMTKQEVKEEHKQAEGDPTAKQRLRQIRQERARQRMMTAVPEADVVITNPTHYAVALKYDVDEMEAPRLVAKGQDLIAQRIREIAQENDIAIVENPPLARALFASVDLDGEVPPEHYQAVAEVISYVWSLRRGPFAGASAPH